MDSIAPDRSNIRAQTSPDAAARPICMIIPPSAFLLDERVFVSLGILRVAAVLEQRGCTVEMLDLSGIENFSDIAALHATSSAASVFALTTTTPQLPAAVRIARAIRSVRPDARIILGGPHVTLVHSAVKLETKTARQSRAHLALERLQSEFDVLVAGDGEFAIAIALEPDAPPLIDGDDPKSGLFMSDADYEDTPMPARHLVDLTTYQYSVDGHNATSIISQLGCPFGCGFCGGRNSQSLRRIRTRSAESVLAELEFLYRTYGYTGFMFYDDELNVSPLMTELMRGIANLQKRLGTEFRLRGFVKAELFTDAQAEAMFAAGFRWLLCGFESGSPLILKNINKKATLEQNTRAVEIARRHGLRVKALMSVGHPGESEETIRATRDWLVNMRPDDFDCSIITTYPGTPYYDEAIPHQSQAGVWTYFAPRTQDRLHAYEVDFTRVAEYYKGDPDGGYHSYVFTDFLSAERLVELRDWVERDVRATLAIPQNPSRAAKRYDHSMGQAPQMLPPFLFRSTPVASE